MRMDFVRTAVPPLGSLAGSRFAGIRRLQGMCPVGGEHVERVRIATAGYAVERYRCAEHGVMTYVHGAVRDVQGPVPAQPMLVPIPSAASRART